MTGFRKLWKPVISITNTMNKLLLYSVIICLLAGCSHKDKNYITIKKFPICSELVPLDTINYNVTEYNPLTVDYVCGYWLVKNIDKDKHCFSILDKELKLISSFGSFGRGPNEFLSPYYVSNNGINADTLNATIRDWTTGRLFRLHVNICDGEYTAEKLTDFGKWMRAIYNLEDGRILCSEENNRYYFTNNALTNKTYLEGWGEEINEATEFTEWYVADNQTGECFPADSSTLLVYSMSYPILYLHSIATGEKLKEVYVHTKPSEIASKNYIPAFSFNPVKYFGNCYIGHFEIRDPNKDIEFYESRLMIFDKDLNPLVEYTVPRIDTFGVNDDTGDVIGINYNEECFYLFDLSEWL